MKEMYAVTTVKNLDKWGNVFAMTRPSISLDQAIQDACARIGDPDVVDVCIVGYTFVESWNIVHQFNGPRAYSIDGWANDRKCKSVQVQYVLRRSVEYICADLQIPF